MKNKSIIYLIESCFVFILLFSQSCKKNDENLSTDKSLRNFSIINPLGGDEPLLFHVSSDTIFINSNYTLRNNNEIVIAFNVQINAQVYLNNELIAPQANADSTYNLVLATANVDKTHSINYSLRIKAENGDAAYYTIHIGYTTRNNNTLSDFVLKASQTPLYLDIKDSLVNIIAEEASPPSEVVLMFKKDETASIYVDNKVLSSNQISLNISSPYTSVLLSVYSENGDVRKYRLIFNYGIDALNVFPDGVFREKLKVKVKDVFYNNLFLAYHPKVLTTDSLILNGIAPHIKSIVGIERFINLKYLNLSNQEIASLVPLAFIENLTSFIFFANETVKINDIGALYSHKNLETLYIDGQNLLDAAFKDINQFTKLKNLSIAHTTIGNEGMNYIGSLTSLKSLSIEKTKVTDLSGLSALSLTSLVCSDLDLANFTAVENMTSLEYLILDDLWYRSPASVNLNKLKHLKTLFCSTWYQTSIIMNELEEIEYINLSKYHLDPFYSIDLSKAAKLTHLSLVLKGLVNVSLNVNAPLKYLDITNSAACNATVKQLVSNSGVNSIYITTIYEGSSQQKPYTRDTYFSLCP
jgi:hypothetical protein